MGNYVDIFRYLKQHNTQIWHKLFLSSEAITDEKTVKLIQLDIIACSIITRHPALGSSNISGVYTFFSLRAADLGLTATKPISSIIAMHKPALACTCAAANTCRCRLINSLSIILQKDLIKSSTAKICIWLSY